jgi:hypothetical protein
MESMELAATGHMESIRALTGAEAEVEG